MANMCYFNCKIAGKKDNVKKAAELLSSFSIGRVREFQILKEEYSNNGNCFVECDGECCWSVETALINTSANIVDLTKKYDLSFESYSEELGFEFQEHHIIKKGVIETEECVDYMEQYIADLSEEEIEDLAEEQEISVAVLKEVAAENEGYYRIGGFLSWDFTI